MTLTRPGPTTGPSRSRLSALVAALVTVLALGTAAPAAAATPDNDTWEAARPLTLGSTVYQDTTEATTDAFDEELNTWCEAPYTNASVWYSYTPEADGTFVLDMSESDFTGGFMVFEGEPSLDTMVDCAPTKTGVSGTAGTTYYLMVFSDTETNGGQLVLSLTEGPPAPTVELAVDPTGTVTKDGTAILTGSFTCTNAEWLDIEVSLTQSVGRFKINGYGWDFFEGQCDGEAHAWQLYVQADNGVFAGGRAASVSYGWAYGEYESGEAYLEQTVKLRKGR